MSDAITSEDLAYAYKQAEKADMELTLQSWIALETSHMYNDEADKVAEQCREVWETHRPKSTVLLWPSQAERIDAALVFHKLTGRSVTEALAHVDAVQRAKVCE